MRRCELLGRGGGKGGRGGNYVVKVHLRGEMDPIVRSIELEGWVNRPSLHKIQCQTSNCEVNKNDITKIKRSKLDEMVH